MAVFRRPVSDSTLISWLQTRNPQALTSRGFHRFRLLVSGPLGERAPSRIIEAYPRRRVSAGRGSRGLASPSRSDGDSVHEAFPTSSKADTSDRDSTPPVADTKDVLPRNRPGRVELGSGPKVPKGVGHVRAVDVGVP